MQLSRIIAIFFFLFWFIDHDGHAQSPGTTREGDAGLLLNQKIADSLEQLIRQSPDDTLKVQRLNLLSGCLQYKKDDSPLKMALEALQLSRSLGYNRGIAASLYRAGSFYGEVRGDRQKEVAYFLQAITVAEKNSLFPELHEFYSGIFNSYFYQGDFPSAMNIAQKGLNYAEKRKEPENILLYSNNIGNIFYRQGNLKEAEKNYLAALSIAEEQGMPEKIASTCLNLADIYIVSKDSARIFQYVERAVSLYRDHLNDAAFSSRRHRYPFALYKKAEYFDLTARPDSAIRYVQQALDLCHSDLQCDLFDVINYYLLAGKLNLESKNYAVSGAFFQRALSAALQTGHKENTRDSYKALSDIYQAVGKYDSALYFFKQYNYLKDEITNTESRTAIARIQGEFDVAKKDEVIARQTNLRNIIIGIFAVFLITAGFLYNRYRLRQRNRYQQELNRQQNELFNAISLAQEQERKRIAQDIHDSLGSVLSAAKLKMAEVKDGKPELGKDLLFVSAIGLLDEASAELRNISHNIMPATLSKLGLVPALKNLSEKISSHRGLQVSFVAHAFENRLDEQTEISIYRIILELINNVVKHAEATRATVQLIRYPDYINITVEDNGKGFDKSRVVEEKAGIGLGSVAARVEYLKGKMDIDSMTGKGTTVMVDIPVAS